MQVQTTNGPVILPPYEQGVLKGISTGVLKIITLTGLIKRELSYFMDEVGSKVT